ncbi:hypothetical protein PAXRUDRAFT_828055 [Paxillus rubicundulus Ve08.2h10]|uniref:Uncharacterized protein n=1 Tax=Paxillus rubicundulus Ve08.2h10 TaxID=930991 RepID=A0A0D0DQ60_9AGAM|nr:hypothetical protein PAXRUDRAFT_828055 [Paxillus rubicundulus Ve08.2h10]
MPVYDTTVRRLGAAENSVHMLSAGSARCCFISNTACQCESPTVCRNLEVRNPELPIACCNVEKTLHCGIIFLCLQVAMLQCKAAAAGLR